MLGHKTSSTDLQEIMPTFFFFSDHGSMKLKINYRKEMDKHTNVESKQHAPKNYGSMKKLKKKTESSQDK